MLSENSSAVTKRNYSICVIFQLNMTPGRRGDDGSLFYYNFFVDHDSVCRALSIWVDEKLNFNFRLARLKFNLQIASRLPHHHHHRWPETKAYGVGRINCKRNGKFRLLTQIFLTLIFGFEFERWTQRLKDEEAQEALINGLRLDFQVQQLIAKFCVWSFSMFKVGFAGCHQRIFAGEAKSKFGFDTYLKCFWQKMMTTSTSTGKP